VKISIDTLNLDIDFETGVFYCGEENSVLYLTDVSTGTDQLGEPFSEWNWTVIYGTDTLTSTEQNPNFLVPNPVSGTIELVASTAFGCEETLIKPFETVVDTPEVLIRDTLFICSGDTIHLNPDFAQIGNFPYQWSPSDIVSDPNAANPEAWPDATTLFTADITGPDSICSFVKEVLVVVEDFPAGLDFVADLNCDGLTVQFTGTGASCYSWDFDGLGTVDDVDNPSFTFPGPGTYMVSVSTCSSSSCVRTVTREVTVFAGTVVAQFDYTIGDCSNQQVLINFIDQSFSMLGPIVDWLWTFDDGTTVTTSNLQNPTYTVTDPTTLTVTLAVTTEDDCTAASMDMLTVTPLSYPGIELMRMVCEGDCVDLNPGGNTNYTYFWFPNIEISSTTVANPEVCPTEDRTYTTVIEGVVISGDQGDRICQSPGITTDVVLKPNPSLAFTFEPACDGLTVNFTNTSTDANCYAWDFDGLGTSAEENPSFTFPAEGTYSVTLSTCDTALCQDSVTLDVDVSLPDLGMFTYEVSDCETDFVEITFTGQTETSLDDVVAWEWTINGEGPFNGQVQTYTVTSSQTVPVQLVITTAQGCEHTLTDDVTVELIVIDLPIITDTLKVCEGGCTELYPNANPDYTYEWTPDNGSLNDPTAPNPIACPSQTTLYTTNIGNIAISGEFDSSVCEVTREVLVVVELLPSDPIDFDFDVQCDGLTVNFDGMNAVCYDWDFGVPGATSDEEDPSFTYPGPGTYTVVMSTCDTAACADLVQKMIILELPEPIDFTYEIGDCDAGTVTIDFMGPATTTLDDIVSWEWMIGTDVLNGQNVSYTVNGDVELPVKLTITTSEGCMDMATDTLTINTIDIESSTTLEYCAGGCVELCPDADPSYTYSWTPDDGTLDDAGAPNPTACPSGNQTYTATIEGVVISGGQGDLLCSVSKEVNVVEVSEPTLDFTFEVACDGITVQFTNTSQAADCYFWDFGVDGIDSDTSILENPVYTFPDTGTYVVTLSTCDDAFCEGSTMKTVELLIGGPVADFTYDISECDTNGLTIIFMDESISILDPIVDWQWLFFPSGTSSDEQNPEITVDTEGDIIVKLTIMTDTGCMDMLFDTLSISLPDSILTDTTLVICTDSCVELNPNGNPNYEYNWMPDDGSLSDPTAANPIACPTEETTYTVTIDNVAITGNDGEKICSITREVTVLFGDVDISVQDTFITCPTDSFELCVTNNIPTDILEIYLGSRSGRSDPE
jgi:PKD repeat protein